MVRPPRPNSPDDSGERFSVGLNVFLDVTRIVGAHNQADSQDQRNGIQQRHPRKRACQNGGACQSNQPAHDKTACQLSQRQIRNRSLPDAVQTNRNCANCADNQRNPAGFPDDVRAQRARRRHEQEEKRQRRRRADAPIDHRRVLFIRLIICGVRPANEIAVVVNHVRRRLHQNGNRQQDKKHHRREFLWAIVQYKSAGKQYGQDRRRPRMRRDKFNSSGRGKRH